MWETTSSQPILVGNLLVGVVGNNCVVIAAEKYNIDEQSICSLNGKITVAWSGDKTNSLKIVEKAKLYTNSVHGLNSSPNHVAEFLIENCFTTAYFSWFNCKPTINVRVKTFTENSWRRQGFTDIPTFTVTYPEIRLLNSLPTLPYTESFMVASCDGNGRYLYVTDIYGTLSHVLASAVGRKSDVITNVLAENYSSAKKGILGTIKFALKTLCVISKPDAEFIEVSVTALNRPFEIVDKTIVRQCLSKIKMSNFNN